MRNQATPSSDPKPNLDPNPEPDPGPNPEPDPEPTQARKLTPEQRKDKKRRKMTNDPSGGGVPVTLYRVEEIPSKQKLYKIDINAQQNHLTGARCRGDVGEMWGRCGGDVGEM
jgi:hypothetical protein